MIGNRYRIYDRRICGGVGAAWKWHGGMRTTFRRKVRESGSIGDTADDCLRGGGRVTIPPEVFVQYS